MCPLPSKYPQKGFEAVPTADIFAPPKSMSFSSTTRFPAKLSPPETLVAKYEKQSGYEREVNNGKKVIADENASKNDITNAKLLIKAKAKEIKEQSLVIETATDWKNFAKRVSGGESFSGKRVVLEKDIDFGCAKISAKRL